MSFSLSQREAFVWLWLPGAGEPVVCGRVVADSADVQSIHRFVYGRSYLNRSMAIPLLPHALPLRAGSQPSRRGLHGILRDAAPDAWGRRVLLYRLHMSVARGEAQLNDLDYLLAGGPGVGALHFQSQPERYDPKPYQPATVEQLMTAALAVDQGTPLPPSLERALLHGTSIGGARPKALIESEDGDASIAKFSSSTDLYPMVKLESLGLTLARAAGLQAVSSRQLSVMKRDVLMINRFDIAGGTRRHFFSALTALDLGEMEARYASYPELADYLRKYGEDPAAQCRELYRRMVFNILIGNTDDHARNHALFWNGQYVRLTPAYDICVMPRVGQEASQAMEVGEQGKRSTLGNALSSAGRFGLSSVMAREISDQLEHAIRDHWQSACEETGIDARLAEQLMHSTVLSPAIAY